MEVNTTFMSVDEFIAKFAAAHHIQDDDYFVRNRETGKLELHFAKESYNALSDEQKRSVKGSFLWGRHSGCWISRCKEPNLYGAVRVAQSLNLSDAGETGERKTFAEQMADKAERAEHRADRLEAAAERAEKRSEALCEPLHSMDYAAKTQPIHNTSAGLAFERQRERIYEKFEKGVHEFNHACDLRTAAKTARKTSAQTELEDTAFLNRRILEREADIRSIQRALSDSTDESRRQSLTERLETVSEELAYYRDMFEKAGGCIWSKENVKPGYFVKMRNSSYEVISTAEKTFRVKETNVAYPYAEIQKIISTAAPAPQPFTVGEKFIVNRFTASGTEEVTYRIIRASDTTVTIQCGDEKSFVRKPRKSWDGTWCLIVCDKCKIGQGMFFKK